MNCFNDEFFKKLNKYSSCYKSLCLISENHIDRIELFGRIPERNTLLKRTTTIREFIYMNEVK